MIYNFDYFIRTKYKSDPYVYRKAKLLVKTSLLTSVFSLFYLSITLIFDMYYGSLAMTYNVISFLLIPFLFRWGLSAIAASHLYTLTGAIGVGICVATENIIETAVIIWFALLPVVALMLSNKISAWIWTGVAYLTVVAFGFVYHYKLIPINETPVEYNTIFQVANITGFILIIFLVVLVFQRTTDNTLESINEKNRLLEEEKKRSEQSFKDLQAAQKQLIQSEKMASLGELTAGIAHEIQNPLNFVNNFSEVSNEIIDEMNDEMDKGNFEEAKTMANGLKLNLEKINLHGKRADAIVKGMLQHSHNRNAIKEATDLNKLADEYFRMAYHGFRAKDKTFNAVMKTDFDNTIENILIIPQEIAKVILNLITNAFHAVNDRKKQEPKGYEPGVSVSTEFMVSGDGRGEALIKVKDNGNGIPQKVLDKIFQPFFTTRPTGQGTGLGLSISYDIIKSHGGELSVETQEGEGSTFIISIPVMM